MEKILSEDYCSYELSKLLKEKGFDGQTHGNMSEIPCVSYITHQMVMKWLREVHGLFIQIGYYGDWADDADGKKVDYWNYWGIDIFYLPSGVPHEPENTDQFDTYEEAVEAAIKDILVNLI